MITQTPEKVGDPFWLVWRKGSTVATVQHGCEAAADAEAERLARAHPGEVFYVMAAVSSVETPPPPAALKVRLNKTIHTDDIPF